MELLISCFDAQPIECTYPDCVTEDHYVDDDGDDGDDEEKYKSAKSC